MRTLILVGGVAALAYAAVLGYLYLYQRQLLYLPDRSRPQLGELARLGVREIALQTTDGLSLLAWYLPPRADRPVIVYFHGNGGHIGYRTDRVGRFAREGYGVLMPEYRGYGGNPGNPSETGFYADADAALAFLDREGIGADRRVLYGESLGSGVAVQIAARHPVGAVILEAPYTSIVAAAQHHYPFVPAALLLSDRYDSLSRIAQVKAPLLIVNGARDTVVPPRLADALFAAAPEPKERWIAAGGGHGDLAYFGALDAAVAFIARHVR